MDRTSGTNSCVKCHTWSRINLRASSDWFRAESYVPYEDFHQTAMATSEGDPYRRCHRADAMNATATLRNY